MWFYDDGHVCGHLNLWIFKLYTKLFNQYFVGDFKFVDCHTHKIHKIKSLMN